ncbi:MAG: hypothetical protein ACOY17_02810 [Pseudomonadota bacterium]
MKNKNLAVVFSLAIFLAAQVVGILHAAAYGAGEHKHHGRVCDIYLHSDQTQHSAPPAGFEFQISLFYSVKYIPSGVTAIPEADYPAGFPRAPPVFLLA